ncbi:phage tail protein [Clostridium butyricum]|uniref:phage tail protein n=1 Tax=Clostridium butyricum TaxID=1492 RepID=UPI0034665EF0
MILLDLYTLVTNIGKAKIANAAVLGKKVDFSKLKVGDGNGNYYEPSESQTNLVHKVWEGNVNNVLTGGEKNPNWIVVQTMIPPGEGGFYIRECGLFDEEDNLLAISKYPESYKPTMDEGSTDDLTIELIFEVSNATTINLKIDPLVTLASLQNLYDLESKINKKIETLSTRLNDLTSDSYPIVEATGTNAYIGASARIKAVGKGTRCTLFVGTASNGNCSLNLNNSGAVAIKDSNGNVVTNMKANIPYNLCHNGSDFILQGKGGGGNLIPKYLLAGYYGEGYNGRVDGAMVNRGAPTSNLNCGGVVNLQEGYYAGGQIIANSLASQTGGATADDTKVLNGYKYWKDGVLRTGNATIQSLGGMPIEKYTFTKSTAYGTEEYFKFGSNIANTIYGKHIVIDVGNGYWTNIYADGVAKDYYLRSGSSSNTYGSGSAIKLLPDEDKVQFKMDKYTNVGVTIDLLVINIYI